jgi:hypothetical protein
VGEPLNLLGVYAPVLLPPAVIGRLRHLDEAADVGDGLALSDQLLRVCKGSAWVFGVFVSCWSHRTSMAG